MALSHAASSRFTASGWPRQSYSTYVVLGPHSSDPVGAQVAQVEAAQSLSLTATVGTVATSGPAGVNRPDSMTYAPAGYDPVYGTLTFVALGNALDANIAVGSGTQVQVDYRRYYPATINTPAEARLALDAAQAIGLEAAEAPRAAFTSEDFAFMLQRKPGAYLWLGQGRAGAGPDGEYPLHHPCYDFNDDALPLGVRWFCEVARRALAAVPSAS